MLATDFETVDIGPCPYEEDCAQCGIDPDFAERNTAECRALANQLKRQFGEPPEGAHLRVKSNPHDFGSYREVVCKTEVDDEAAMAYAYRCQENLPARWDDEARAELAAAGFPVPIAA